MAGQPHVSPKFGKASRGARAVIALFGALALLLLSTTFAANADAAGTDNAQLSLTGVVDGNNPTGGSELGVHPGTTINFKASAAPTQKVKDLVDSLGLGSLLDSLLSNVTFQVKADFSHLPGGKKDTVLSGNASKSFTFSHTGTYSFSYHAERVSVGLLGKTVAPINLDGNQAKKAGVELNASNDYVGRIVVSKSPKNGISVQLPSVHLKPKVAGQKLPSVDLPGVTTPKVRTEIPKVTNPLGGGKTTTPTPGSGSNSGGSQASSNPTQQLPVPTRVMGSIGDSSGYYGGGSGGFYGDAVTGDGAGSVGSNQSFLPGSNSSGADNPGNDTSQGDTPKTKRADLASNGAPSAQLPVVLAILAIVALSLMTATYARLFMLRRSTVA